MTNIFGTIFIGHCITIHKNKLILNSYTATQLSYTPFYVSHFLTSIPSGGKTSNSLSLASSQFVVKTVPFD